MQKKGIKKFGYLKDFQYLSKKFNNTMDKQEIWMPIPDYEGFYEVSNLGRVRSVDREVADRSGRVRIFKGKVRKPVMNRGGYLLVLLYKD